MATVDATHYKSPNAYQEFIAGLVDGGEITLVTQAPPQGPIAFSRDALNIVNLAADIEDGKKVRVFTTNALPTGLAIDTDYFIFQEPPDPPEDPPTGDYYFSTDPSGTPIVTLSSNGTGTQFLVNSEEYWFQILQRLQFRNVRELGFVFPNGVEAEVDVLVTNFGISAPLNDKITTSVTFKLTSKLTWAE